MTNAAIGDTNDLPAAGAADSTSQTNSPSSDSKVSMDTKIRTLEDLKKKAPKVFRAMMEGIAMHVAQEMEKHQARLKRLMQEQRRDAQG